MPNDFVINSIVFYLFIFFLYTYQVIKLRIIFEFLFYNYIILIVFVQLTVLATITLQIKTDMICGRLYITSWMAYRNSKQLINAPLYEKSFSKYLIIFNSCHVLNMVVASAQWTDLFAFNFFFFLIRLALIALLSTKLTVIL